MRTNTQTLPRADRALLSARIAHAASPRVGDHLVRVGGTIDDLRREICPPADIARLLRQLGVPFATFDPTLRCTELSPAARTLLGDEAEYVCRLGARLLESLPGDAERTPYDQRSESTSSCSPVGRHILRAQRFPHGDPHRMGIVLILPIRGANGQMESQRWGLSRREAEVAALIIRGASTADVACALGISAHTVRRHTERIYAKLGVRTRMQLVTMLGGSGSPVEPSAEK
jgi:DNA-binding CsgD family transcriptional regulator